MKLEEALNIVKQALGAFVGNLADHQRIQEAIRTIEAALEPKPKKKS